MTCHSILLLILLCSGLPSHQNQPTADFLKSQFGEDYSVVFKECRGDDLSLYFFVPQFVEQREKRPAIIFFFGGGWVGGTPAQFKPHADYLKSRGMIAILADYRTKKSHGATPKQCVADAKSAMRYLRANAAKHQVDPDRLVAAGGSAGGHLAAATATVSAFDEQGEDTSVSAVPNALVLFNPVYDNSPGQWGNKSVIEYWRQISPAHNIRAGMPPAIVFLGSNDKLISVATAREFQAKMKAVESRSDLHIYEGKGHGFFNYGRDENISFADTVAKMDKFLVELGYLKGECSIQEFLKNK